MEYSFESNRKTCLKKKRFHGHQVNDHIKRKEIQGFILRAYLCPVCDMFHMASDKEKIAKLNEGKNWGRWA